MRAAQQARSPTGGRGRVRRRGGRGRRRGREPSRGGRGRCRSPAAVKTDEFCWSSNQDNDRRQASDLACCKTPAAGSPRKGRKPPQNSSVLTAKGDVTHRVSGIEPLPQAPTAGRKRDTVTGRPEYRPQKPVKNTNGRRFRPISSRNRRVLRYCGHTQSASDIPEAPTKGIAHEDFRSQPA